MPRRIERIYRIMYMTHGNEMNWRAGRIDMLFFIITPINLNK